MTLSIAILGAGAVGGYYGARLAHHGHAVHFLLRSDYAAVRERGLRVRSVDGDFHLRPDQLRVYSAPEAMPKVDLVLVTLKSTENHQLPRLLPPLLKDDTAILTLQNGLGNEGELARLFGAERVLGGMAFVCINRTAPGEIDHSDYGVIKLGEFKPAGGSSRSARAERIAALLQASRINAAVLDDLRAGRWDKQVWNVPFNGLGTLLDATTDVLLSTDAGVREVRALMDEVMATAAAEGVVLPADIAEKKIAATRSMGRYRTSTQIDRQNGRPLEIDAIFARPVELARRHGVPVPRMELLLFALETLAPAPSPHKTGLG
jgi:2-dehydropantoate 2-reductase